MYTKIALYSFVFIFVFVFKELLEAKAKAIQLEETLSAEKHQSVHTQAAEMASTPRRIETQKIDVSK